MSCGRKIGPYDCCSVVEGDCLELMKALPDGCVDAVVTDPPYSSGARRDSERAVRGASMLRETEDADWFSHDQMTTWGFTWFLRGLLSETRRTLHDGSHVYIFCDWRQQPNVYGIIESVGLRVNHTIVWDKVNFGMGCYFRNQHEFIVFGSAGMPAPMAMLNHGSVVSIPRERGEYHPTEKPESLMGWLIEAITAQTILDPFCGSGTTLVAAAKLGRHFLGFEISPEYCAVARKRLALVEAQPNLFQPKAEQLTLGEGTHATSE
jgi:site-specific DNA-methyltransferase (adenine-specific)